MMDETPNADSQGAARDPKSKRVWRYSTGTTTPDPAPEGKAADFEKMLDTAWRELLHEHMAFGMVAIDERERLVRSLRDIERAFSEATDTLTLGYYRESFFGEKPVPDVQSRTQLRHVVLMQAQLMEQAFFALSLSRSANAPVNRGWMNLFRCWAGSSTFNFWFDGYRELFSRQFIAFYDNYLRYYNVPIDVAPVPHPWDRPIDRKVVPPPPPDAEQKQRLALWQKAGLAEPKRAWRVPGVYLDSGIVESPVDALTGESADASGGTVHPGSSEERDAGLGAADTGAADSGATDSGTGSGGSGSANPTPNA